MATEYFLVINGIAGDFSDQQLTGAFSVGSFDFLSSNAGSAVGGGTVKTSFDTLMLSLNSESLAGLLAASSSGNVLTGASLVGRTTINGKTLITSSLNLANVVIADVTDITQGFNLTLNYGQIGLVTTDYDSNGTQQRPSQTFAWDVQLNKNPGGGGKSLTSAGVQAVAATQPATYYLLVDGVNGGSTDPGHVGWFELKDFNFNLANSTDPQVSGGGAGADTFGDLSVTTLSEAGLTALLAKEAAGSKLAGVRVEGVDGLGNAVYDLNLATVLLTRIDDRNSAGFGISFDYSKISLVTEGESSGGKLVQTGAFGWDVAANKSISPLALSLNAGTAATTTTTTTEYFLVLNGIAGDFSDQQLTGAFAVNLFDFPSSNTGSAVGGGTVKTSFDPLKLSLNGESLAGLLAASSSGNVLTGASLVGRTTINGKTVITSSLNLANVVITDVSESDITQGFDLTLDYGQIGLVTTNFDSNGTPQGSQTFAWDVQLNKNPGGGGKSLTSAGVQAVAATQPATYYLLVDGVNGGSTDPGHVGWFELKDFNFNLANSTDPQTGGGGADTFGDLSVTTLSEAGLTALLAKEAAGSKLAGVRVEGVDGLGNAVYDLNLATVLLTKIEDKDSAGFGISFDYSKISLVTEGQKSGGSYVQTGAFGWDVAANKSISPLALSLNAGTAATTTTTTTEYFLVLNGIAGDFSDQQLTGAFAVNSFDFPSSNAGSAGGAGTVKTSFDPLKLSLNGESLAGLLAASSSGNGLTGASLVGRTTINGKTVITSSLNLANVVITDVTDITQGFDLTLDYGQIGLVTTNFDSNGTPQGSQTFAWDVQLNKNPGGGGKSLTSAGVQAVAATQPATYYLLVDGVNGGSTDPGHVGWFVLKDFNFNLANSTDPQTGGGGADTFGDLSVATLSEAGLTALLAKEAAGSKLAGVRIEGVDGFGNAVYDLNLATVLLTRIDDRNSAGFGISFDYSKISLVTEGESSGGKLVQTGAFGWDVAANKSISPLTVNISPCYCPGTLILTEHGEVPVENLAIGDVVATMSGAARPIKWIGRRSYAGRFVIGQKDILPVCIKAGAIDENIPRRDLWISPHHAMYLEGVLIEARDLVNDVTIFQAERVEKVEYFHIELETHDVLIAEGSLSESFIDDDSRNMFHNAHEFGTLYPDDLDPPARYCAPRCADGYEVEFARRRLAVRAGLRTLDDEPRIGTLRGYVDLIGAEIISGWAQNVDHPEAPVCLDIHADGRWVGQALANRYRGDLERAGLGSGRHSFEFVPPAGLVSPTTAIEVRRALDSTALASSHAVRKADAA